MCVTPPRPLLRRAYIRGGCDRWQVLRSEEEMETYNASMAADCSLRKTLIPGAIVKRSVYIYICTFYESYLLLTSCQYVHLSSKLRYLYMEAFGDLEVYMWGSFGFYTTLAVYVFALWLRAYVHFLGQYLYLQVIIILLFIFVYCLLTMIHLILFLFCIIFTYCSGLT